MPIYLKYLMTAGLVVIISEIAKRNDQWGGLMASLPLVTLLTLVWMHVEHQSIDKIANHAGYTFWYVLPTLPFFLIFPALLKTVGFWLALLISVGITLFIVLGTAKILALFGIHL
ncbi:MAG: hypothetical protein RLY58_1728 [Pseudomonadota bacterium]|jgi:hypothetical protein